MEIEGKNAMRFNKGLNHSGKQKVMKKNRGFTLLELLTVVAIASILVAMAAPSVNETVQTSKLNSSADSLYAMIRFTRAEATRLGSSVIIGAADGVDWASGALVWTEADGNKIYNAGAAGETLIRRSYGKAKIDIKEAADNTTVTYNGQGYANAQMIFNVCDHIRSGEKGRTITVLVSGFSIMKQKVTACD